MLTIKNYSKITLLKNKYYNNIFQFSIFEFRAINIEAKLVTLGALYEHDDIRTHLSLYGKAMYLLSFHIDILK